MSSKLTGAILLIVGTTIGAGSLVFPALAAQYGFFLAVVICFFVSGLLMYSALLMVEVNLWLPEKTNLISIAKVCLGKKAQLLIWIFYLLMFYTLLTTYLTALSSITIDLAQDYFNITLSRATVLFLYLGLLGIVAYLGIKILDTLNRVLVLCLVISFLLILSGLFVSMQPARLLRVDLAQHINLLPLAVAAFSYQFIIPVLRDFLDSDLQQLRKAIIIGSIIPLVAYLLWLAIILSAMPASDLKSIATLTEPSTALALCLAFATQHHWVDLAFRWFAYFAILTSLLGLIFSVLSFFRDGFRVQHWKLGRVIAIIITFLPPALYTYFFWQGYTLSLRYSGLVVLVLYVIIPVLMVWQGRYRKSLAFGYSVRGGKLALITLLVCSAFIIFSGI